MTHCELVQLPSYQLTYHVTGIMKQYPMTNRLYTGNKKKLSL
jgi:hypothetical protein